MPRTSPCCSNSPNGWRPGKQPRPNSSAISGAVARGRPTPAAACSTSRSATANASLWPSSTSADGADGRPRRPAQRLPILDRQRHPPDPPLQQAGHTCAPAPTRYRTAAELRASMTPSTAPQTPAGRHVDSLRLLWSWQRWMTGWSNTSRTARRSALAPSITTRMGRVTSKPRSRSPVSRSVTTMAFSVAPSTSPAGSWSRRW